MIATVTPDTGDAGGTWSADNVPVTPGGVAIFDLNAVPPGGGDPGNSVEKDKPARLLLLNSHSLHKDETFDDNTGYLDNSDGSQGDWLWHWQTDNYNDVSHDWHDGTGGGGAMHNRSSTTGSGYCHVPITPWSSQAAIQISWPGSDWPTVLNGTATGDLAAYDRVCTPQGETGPPVIYQIPAGVSAGVNLNTWTHSFQPSWDLIDECDYWIDDWHYYHHSYSAQDTYQLQTGGRASSHRQNLFGLSIGLSEPVVRDSVLVDDGYGAYIPGPASPIQPQTSKVDGQPVGSDGNQWRTYKDNDTRDVTPRVKNEDFYTFNVGEQKYNLAISANSITLSNDVVATGANFCVGQKINFEAVFSPSLSDLNYTRPIWNYTADYVNNHWTDENGCEEYNVAPITSQSNPTVAWFYNKQTQDATANFGIKCVFNNGQSVYLVRQGKFNVYRPSLTPLDVSSCSGYIASWLKLSFYPGIGFQTHVNSQYQGEACFTQVFNDQSSPISSGTNVLDGGSEFYPFPTTTSHPQTIITNSISANYISLIDSPYETANPFTGNASLIIQFTDYARFRPDIGNPSDNIYVTLGKVTWSLNASQILGTLSPSGPIAPSPSLVPSQDFPFWSSVKSKGSDNN